MTEATTPPALPDVSSETWTLRYYRVDGWPSAQLCVGDVEITMIRGIDDPAQRARAQLAKLAPEMLRACIAAETVLSLPVSTCNDAPANKDRCGECLGCLIDSSLTLLRSAIAKAQRGTL